MTAMASSSISSRSSGAGQWSPRMCSFRFSPEPTPRKNRPSINTALVAAACATIAGWMRIVGHVTPVPRRIRSVACAIAPITPQTNGEFPWLSVHGWKWSEIIANSNPMLSAFRAFSTSALGECSSEERAYPNSVMFWLLPRQVAGETASADHALSGSPGALTELAIRGDQPVRRAPVEDDERLHVVLGRPAADELDERVGGDVRLQRALDVASVDDEGRGDRRKLTEPQYQAGRAA